MSSAKPKVSSSQFKALESTLIERFTAGLEHELADCALPNLPSGLWDLPVVDSKTVCKLSPIVKELLGRRLEPSWVRKGGYESVKAAVEDLMSWLRKVCVFDTPSVAPAISAKSKITA
jgi:hypothetical protein